MILKSISNIKKLIEYKKLNSDIIIGVGFVVTKENFKEIKTFSEIFKDMDVDYCQFKPEIIQIEETNMKKIIFKIIKCKYLLTFGQIKQFLF